MTQRERILEILEYAGDEGVFSFQLLDITPRYAARICELNKLGYDITSVPERGAEAMGVRYTLNVGTGASAERERSGQTGYVSGGWDSSPSGTRSGVEDSSQPPAMAAEAPPASPYDPFEEWAA
jgi:hypothetical protein